MITILDYTDHVVLRDDGVDVKDIFKRDVFEIAVRDDEKVVIRYTGPSLVAESNTPDENYVLEFNMVYTQVEDPTNIPNAFATVQALATYVYGLFSGQNLMLDTSDTSLLTFSFDPVTNTWTLNVTDKLKTEEAIVYISNPDEDAAVSTSRAAYFPVPFGANLTDVVAYTDPDNPPTGDDLIIDIELNGVTIFATKLQIDDGDTTSATSATPYVFSTTPTPVAQYDILGYFIDQVGSTNPGQFITITHTFVLT